LSGKVFSSRKVFSARKVFFAKNRQIFYSIYNKLVSKLRVLIILFVVIGILFSFWYFLIKKTPLNFVSPFAKLIGSGGGSKTVENPLTGIMYTEQEAASWKGVRPLGVMVNNYNEARPQSGLTKADVVYEMVAEGGITRYLAFFLTNVPLKVGPIRSIREYYLEIVREMGDAMIMHIGWSPQALTAIETWPVRSLIRLGLNCDVPLPDPTDQNCWRNKVRVDGGIPWEHTAYGNVVELRKMGDAAGWQGEDSSYRVWKFKDNTAAYSSKPSVSEISIDFWYKGDYSAAFKYDLVNNAYLRSYGFDINNQPIPHKDAETGKQIEIKNVIVQFATETAIFGDEKNRLSYQLVGSGSALVFIDGKVVEATWSKASRDERTIFYDTNGSEMQFNRGNFWISIVPDRNKDQVVYF